MTDRAIVVSARDTAGALTTRSPTDPEPGDGVLAVSWSGINYKDALAVAGKPGVLRRLPMTPGIDAVGALQAGAPAPWRPGQRVVVTGAGLGEWRDGGFADRVDIPLAAAVPLPDGMTERRAAAIGTAGVTAALAVLAVEAHRPQSGPVLVTGSGGGVGGFAIALLAARGHDVVASSGRPELEEHLLALGAGRVVDRLPAEPGKAMQTSTWAAVLDGVGGGVLANAIAQSEPGGIVAAYGLAGGSGLPTTVLPFILRGVTLAGIDSVGVDPIRRAAAWRLLASLPAEIIDRMVERDVALDEVPAAAQDVLAGRVRGRVVVRIGG